MGRQVGMGVVGFNPAHSEAYHYVNTPGVTVEMYGAHARSKSHLAVDPEDVNQYGWQKAIVMAEERLRAAYNFKNRAQRRKEAKESRRNEKRASHHR